MWIDHYVSIYVFGCIFICMCWCFGMYATEWEAKAWLRGLFVAQPSQWNVFFLVNSFPWHQANIHTSHWRVFWIYKIYKNKVVKFLVRKGESRKLVIKKNILHLWNQWNLLCLLYIFRKTSNNTCVIPEVCLVYCAYFEN